MKNPHHRPGPLRPPLHGRVLWYAALGLLGSFAALAALGIVPFRTMTASASLTSSGPLVISGQSNKVYSNLRITNPSGTCVTITNSTNITIEGSDIGPCAGHGVLISGGSGNQVYDNYIHVESAGSGGTDTREDVRINGASTNDTVQGNVLAYSETNVRLDGGVSQITINGNYMLNPLGPFPRGQNFQSDHTSAITVSNNYTFSCRIGAGPPGVRCPTTGPAYLYSESQEDNVNFYYTTNYTASNNYVEGGHSSSGQGLISDAHSDQGNFLNNVVVDTGHGGIGINQGANVVSGNKVFDMNPVDTNEQGIAIANTSNKTFGCGPVTVSNNYSTAIRTVCNPSTQSCAEYGYWSSSSCSPITTSGNTFDNGTYGVGGGPAYKAMVNDPAVVNPPPIPPLPKNCVAPSPYSNNTSFPPCGGGTGPGDTTKPSAPTGLTVTAVSSSQINLSWSASTDPDNTASQLIYIIYRNGSPISTTAAGVTSYPDTGLSPSTSYTYTVAASDPAGNISPQSSPPMSQTTQAGVSAGCIQLGAGVSGSPPVARGANPMTQLANLAWSAGNLPAFVSGLGVQVVQYFQPLFPHLF